jgi:AraC-like DNA-binding protein
MGSDQQIRLLFEYLPDVDFFVKDRCGRFVAASIGVLRRVGFSKEDQILGLTDCDIHPPRIASELRTDDEQVMAQRRPLIDRVEALYTRSQAKDWYVTTKLPVFDAEGEVIGVMGIVRPYRSDGLRRPGSERIERVVSYIQENHARSLAIAELAKVASVSTRQLHRLFKDVFGMSTEAFIVRTRVQAASDDLMLTNKSMSEVAIDHGFCDQSAFSRHFTQHTGETPLKFRKRRKSVADVR